MSGSGNPLKRGRHRKPSTTHKTLARTVFAGAVIGAPLATAGTAQAASDNVWDRVAQCESGGNWTINTGNGFQGGLQFTQSTWRSFGGSVFASSANRATRDEQIAVAEKVLAGQGWGAWPVCSHKAHATGQPATPRVVSARSIGTKTTKNTSTGPTSTGRHTLRPTRTTPPAQPQSSVTAQQPVAPTTPVFEVADRLKPLVMPAEPTAPMPLSALPLDNPAPTPAAAPVPAPRTYQVHQGDTLTSIASTQHVTGGWQAIYQTNRGSIGDANLIRPGQQLTLS
jgi:resuscitation-promoting factor RpfA